MDHLPRFFVNLQALQQRLMRLSPSTKQLADRLGVGRELTVREDRGLDLLRLDARLAVPLLAVVLEQRLAQRGKYRPVRAQGVDVPVRNPTIEVRVQIVQVFGFRRVDVTRNVQVVVVRGAGDLAQRHHPRVTVELALVLENIDNLVNVLSAKAVLVPILHKLL